MTAPRPAALFRDPWLNNNAILLEYLSQAELDKHGGRGGGGASSERGKLTGGDDLQGMRGVPPSATDSLEMADGTCAGVVSLRRPLVERLRLTAAAMESSAAANVAQLAASTIFDGDGSGSGTEQGAELRRLIVALQDVTAERDEAQAKLNKLHTAAAAGEEGEELASLRAENASLRAENANMFALSEENEALRTLVETLQLKLDCAGVGRED